MSKILVVGANSFIGKHMSGVDCVSYKDFKSKNLSEYDTVINCALDPSFKIAPYREVVDVDLIVGQRAIEHNCHYVMISTSKVYGNSKELITYDEFSTVDPDGYYGENKLNTEIKLLANFPSYVTILRGSNVFGFEYGRNSYMGYCMSRLVNEGRVTLTFNADTKRDFLFVEDAARIIKQVAEQKPIGVFNLSSGLGLSAKSIAESLISGYDYGGKVVYTSDAYDRQFVLDNSKIKRQLDIIIDTSNYHLIIQQLGKLLSSYKTTL